MRVKTDENLHPDMAAFFRAKGHDAVAVWDEGLRGHSDEEVAAACHRERRALVTQDVGFGDITAYPPQQYPGLIVLRLGNQSRQAVQDVLSRVFPLIEARGVRGRLWVIDERHVRMRGGQTEGVTE
jgi:predicted nuclease of predicted toxin-antitoxin system